MIKEKYERGKSEHFEIVRTRIAEDDLAEKFKTLKIETIEDAVKQMSIEEIKKKIDVLEKFKTFKEAREKRDSAYNNFKETELAFSIAKEAYIVAVKSV